MKVSLLVFSTFLLACTAEPTESNSEIEITNCSTTVDLDEPQCPKGHTDEIIPIAWGKPSKEGMAKADSGLIWLGGCIMTENSPSFHCKIHDIEF